MMMKKGIIILLVFLCACNDNGERKFGLDFNATRKQVGLPVLDKHWKISNTGKDYNGIKYIEWTNKSRSTNPRLFKKSIRFTNDTILYEENQYIGKNTYSTIDGTFQEEIFVTFNFVNDDSKGVHQNAGWEYVFINSKTFDNDTRQKISKIDCDSILASWKF